MDEKQLQLEKQLIDLAYQGTDEPVVETGCLAIAKAMHMDRHRRSLFALVLSDLAHLAEDISHRKMGV